MKKILIMTLASFLFMTIGANAQRFATNPKKGDNTGRMLTLTYSNLSYASTKTIVPNASEATYSMDSLTSTLSVTVTTTLAQKCDKLKMFFKSDSATAGHVVTFSTGFAPSGTLTVDKNQRASASFEFMDGVYVETGRAKE